MISIVNRVAGRNLDSFRSSFESNWLESEDMTKKYEDLREDEYFRIRTCHACSDEHRNYAVAGLA